jgi:hypothetical protein
LVSSVFLQLYQWLYSRVHRIMSAHATVLLALAAISLAQSLPPGVSSPVAQTCGPSSANIVCLDKYASVLPYHFFRNRTVSEPLTFGSTSVPNDTSFGLVDGADFLVFDQARALELLGDSPTYEFIFEVSPAVHEAPVYVPSLNKLFMSQLAPPAGYLPQLVVDLNQDPPTLSEYLSDPPVYAPNGGTFHNGLIYWGKLSHATLELIGLTFPSGFWGQQFHWRHRTAYWN